MCRTTKSTHEKHQTEEASCQMVKTLSILHHSKKLIPVVSGKDGTCACSRQKITCWRLGGYVHPVLQANVNCEENLKVIGMVGFGCPLVRAKIPRANPCNLPAPEWPFSSSLSGSPPHVISSERPSLTTRFKQSPLLTTLRLPFLSTNHNQKSLY